MGTAAFAASAGGFAEARHDHRSAVIDIEAARLACRGLVRRRATLAAASSLIPLPGVDIVTDVAVLLNLIREIQMRFGLSAAQLEALAPARRVLAYRLIVSAGSLFARKVAAPSVLLPVLRLVGVRLTVMETTRVVPIVGQAIAAAIGFWAVQRIAGAHVEECAALARRLQAGDAADAADVADSGSAGAAARVPL